MSQKDQLFLVLIMDCS